MLNSLDLLIIDGSPLARALAAAAFLGMGATAYAVWQIAKSWVPWALAVCVAVLWAVSDALRAAIDDYRGVDRVNGGSQ